MIKKWNNAATNLIDKCLMKVDEYVEKQEEAGMDVSTSVYKDIAGKYANDSNSCIEKYTFSVLFRLSAPVRQ